MCAGGVFGVTKAAFSAAMGAAGWWSVDSTMHGQYHGEWYYGRQVHMGPGPWWAVTTMDSRIMVSRSMVSGTMVSKHGASTMLGSEYHD